MPDQTDPSTQDADQSQSVPGNIFDKMKQAGLQADTAVRAIAAGAAAPIAVAGAAYDNRQQSQDPPVSGGQW